MLFRHKQTYQRRTSFRRNANTKKDASWLWLKIVAPASCVIIAAGVSSIGPFTTAIPRIFNKQAAVATPATSKHPQTFTSPVTSTSISPARSSQLQPEAKIVSSPTPPPPQTACSTNKISKLVVVSLSQQHMWACSLSQLTYETPVTTGAYEIDGDATPTGTWHIYDKQTKIYLTGPGYKDFVQYWIAFYADYGFHDASWQTFPFGDVKYATEGSHGCVHLPDAAATWLYNWAPIGTTVTIEA